MNLNLTYNSFCSTLYKCSNVKRQKKYSSKVFFLLQLSNFNYYFTITSVVQSYCYFFLQEHLSTCVCAIARKVVIILIWKTFLVIFFV